MIFYEVKVNYTRQTGEDNPGKVREAYLVESINCSNAESRTIEFIEPYIFGDLETPQIKKRQFFEILPLSGSEYWYEGKVELITIEDSGEEKRHTVNILVQANGFTEALTRFKDAMNGYDCEIIGLKKSAIIEVLRTSK